MDKYYSLLALYWAFMGIIASFIGEHIAGAIFWMGAAVLVSATK